MRRAIAKQPRVALPATVAEQQRVRGLGPRTFPAQRRP